MNSPAHRVRALLLVLGAMAATMLLSAPSAQAYQPVDIVHTEQVQAGPYHLTVGFSKWPLRATQSLDFTFAPDGGVRGKSGTLTVTGPGQEAADSTEAPSPLSRHPRKRSVWGLDVQSLPTAGRWTFAFTINGPEGRGTGTLDDITVLEQPGPPLALSWSICALPAVGLIAFLTVAWRRHHPSRHLATLRL